VRLHRAATASDEQVKGQVVIQYPGRLTSAAKVHDDSLQYPETVGMAMTNTVNNP
jgi:hypothetical protein